MSPLKKATNYTNWHEFSLVTLRLCVSVRPFFSKVTD